MKPRAVHTIKGARIGDYQPRHEIKGNGSALVFDFGVEVGGIVSFGYQSTGNASIGLAFTESKNYIGYGSDSSNGMFQRPGRRGVRAGQARERDAEVDDAAQSLRGGFRYLTIFLNNTDSATTVQFSNIETEIAFQPTWPNMRAYQGYFHSSDDTLNKICSTWAPTPWQTNLRPDEHRPAGPHAQPRVGQQRHARPGGDHHRRRREARSSRLAGRHGDCGSFNLL